ncbi:MAG: hypothetical protein JWN69_1684 [Alphaproteobacteria bacterium]|nr:hypothetical protein [Alphaproteobacteria bacterium]
MTKAPQHPNLLHAPILTAGALLALLGVALGAFGAHALQGVLDARSAGWWQTAVQYQMWHAVALVAIAALPLRGARPAALLLLLGTILFSGSLYAMALGGWRWLGMVTPLGGLLMLAGWLVLALAGWADAMKNKKDSND